MKVTELLKGLLDITDIVNANEDKYANVFSSLALFQKPINQIILYEEKRFIKKYLNNYGVALDVGVGCGMIAGELVKAGYNVHGVDIDPYALVVSAHYIEKVLKGNFLPLLADVNNPETELPQGFYDVISCTSTLEHIKNDKLVLKKLYDALVLGGTGIISVPLGDIDLKILPIPKEIEHYGVKCYAYGDHLREYNKLDFMSTVTEVGFDIIDNQVLVGDGDGRSYNVLYLIVKKGKFLISTD